MAVRLWCHAFTDAPDTSVVLCFPGEEGSFFFEVGEGQEEEVEEEGEVECRGGEKKKQWRKGWVHTAAQMDRTEKEDRRRRKKKLFFLRMRQ